MMIYMFLDYQIQKPKGNFKNLEKICRKHFANLFKDIK